MAHQRSRRCYVAAAIVVRTGNCCVYSYIPKRFQSTILCLLLRVWQYMYHRQRSRKSACSQSAMRVLWIARNAGGKCLLCIAPFARLDHFALSNSPGFSVDLFTHFTSDPSTFLSRTKHVTLQTAEPRAQRKSAPARITQKEAQEEKLAPAKETPKCHVQPTVRLLLLPLSPLSPDQLTISSCRYTGETHAPSVPDVNPIKPYANLPPPYL